MRPIWIALVVAGLASVACSSEKKTYPVTFTCNSPGTAACPSGQTCPEQPLGSGGCEDLPGLFDNPPSKVDKGRPEGCQVGLSYGNPYYSDSQQTCNCRKQLATDKAPSWDCPI